MKRNVYDFDGTIYDGDSTVDFHRFCRIRYPRVLLDLFGSGFYYLGMALGVCSKTRAKERFYRFLTFLPDVDGMVSAFWIKHEKNLKGWYLAQKTPEDLIISASPEFLLRPVCDKLGVRLIASRVDKRTGATAGLNCHDTEKVRRMRELYPDCQMQAFYSDSKADTPLAQLAERAYMVRGNTITPFF